MSSTTYTTLVFTGPDEEIKLLDHYINSIRSERTMVNSQKLISDHGSFASLKLSFETPGNPPFKVIDQLHERVPSIKGVHRTTSESNFYETIVIRRDPLKGFQKCLVDDPLGINTDKSSSSIEVLNEYIDDLGMDEELTVASEMIGITLERVQQRQEGLLKFI